METYRGWTLTFLAARPRPWRGQRGRSGSTLSAHSRRELMRLIDAAEDETSAL